MNKVTRYQAIRSALQELGPTASKEQVAEYIEKHFAIRFEDEKSLTLFMSMVNSKMTRKGRKSDMPSSMVINLKKPS